MNKLALAFAALALATLAASTAASTATAGQRGPWGYRVDPVARYANGAFSELRDTPDMYSRAECGNSAQIGMCAFVDSTGNYHACYTTNPDNIEVIRSMSSDTFFNVAWSAAGQCDYVLAYTSSVSNPRSH
jgi:hypothetical protein